ncbi:uncharacterized protein LOC119373451 isoform X2 [Rhipicephalus sanguineus]|uniref:uncharacterized protein LOC119373451 isoform X2 n=1 Tax=Rhipicephalus sanguineus TaxID=34632 RepID=UPI00189400B4|nr:uncharacterized protein LOC119373451 isoform X2 [Rhipicephalus sanguineus]
MQKDGIISAFVCIFVIGPLRSDGWPSPKVIPNMAKFLNTSDPIWSYMTTSTTRGYDCKVDVIDNMYNEDVLFRRFLGYRKAIISDWVQFLEGHLYHERARARAGITPYNAMKVSYKDGQDITYELRVKNSTIVTANRTDCFKAYPKIAKKEAKLTYLPDCQDILIGMNNFIPGRNPHNGAVGLIYFLNTKPSIHAPMGLSDNRMRVARISVPSWLT